MSRNILAEAIARTLGSMLGSAIAPVTGKIPWVVRLGCALLVTGLFFLVLLFLVVAVSI